MALGYLDAELEHYVGCDTDVPVRSFVVRAYTDVGTELAIEISRLDGTTAVVSTPRVS